MKDNTFGLILEGDINTLKKSLEEHSKISVNLDLSGEKPSDIHKFQKTTNKPVEVSAPGTFHGKKIRKLRFEPTDKEGWWFNRTDRPGSLPVRVSIRNVWTTGEVVSNIVLRSGSSHNYIRLVEHIIALKRGMDIDNLMIHLDSGDPPLFEKGSFDLVQALNAAGRKETTKPVKYFTVKEKVSMLGPGGGFIIISPYDGGRKSLDIDCTRSFPNAIGKQRLKFSLNEKNFSLGAEARTNATTKNLIFCKTIGKLFAETRHLGYTKKNVLIAGKTKYVNKPRLIHNDKCLEPVWHRAVLDLLAAIALIEEGRLLGNITCYKGGHQLDVDLIKALYTHDLLEEINFVQ